MSATTEASGCHLINEERFFRHIAPFVGDSERLVEEAIENALRAHATRVDVDLSVDEKGGRATLAIQNDGEVLEDFSKLFVVAESGYDEKVMREHKPAGMGILMMLAACRRAVFHSGDRRIAIETEAFFTDPEYRAALFGRLETTSRFEGMRIALEGPATPLAAAYDRARRMDQRYPMEIYFDGEQNAPTAIDAVSTKEGGGILEGCRVHFLGLGDYLRPYWHSRWNGPRLYWHGKPVTGVGLERFVVEVTGENGFIRLRLPDRTQCLNTDEEIKALQDSCKELFREEIQKELSCMVEKAETGNRQHCEAIERAVRDGYVPAEPLDNLPFWQGIERERVEEGALRFVKDLDDIDIEYAVDGKTEWRIEAGDHNFSMFLDGVVEKPKSTDPAPAWFAAIEPLGRCTLRLEGSGRLESAAAVAKNHDYVLTERLLLGGRPVEGALYDRQDSAFVGSPGDIAAWAKALADRYSSDFDESTTYDEVLWNIREDVGTMQRVLEGGVTGWRELLENVARAVEIRHGEKLGGAEGVDTLEFRHGDTSVLLVNGRFEVGL